ncbi:MAG TPA: transposase [Novosphingobium sp.]|nr:transposase [Novosphingobium sp.]
MPRVIELADDGVIGLDECVERLSARGFDPHDEESLHQAGRDLAQLGNDHAFLGDMLVDELKLGCDDAEATQYGPQTVMLSRPAQGFFLRANIWPSADEHAFRASGEAPFYFDVPHDHNFSFLTLGYFGPGYWSDYYEYDFESVAGYAAEPVDLRFVERSRLEPGKLMLYRAHRDVHVQHPADALSVSLNVMHMAPHQGWFDQYRFDVKNKRIAGILSHGASEVTLRLAVALGLDEARDLAAEFGRGHPSDRMRLAAWDALALDAGDDAARDAVWLRAEASGSLMVAREAAQRRAMLA